MVTFCEDKVVNANGEVVDYYKCPGHMAKFDDCVQEGLYELVLDNCGEQSTGSDDFEGTYCLFNFPTDEVVQIGPDSAEERWVVVPEGYYILHTTTGGLVYTLKYDTYQEAREAFEAADDRYYLWDKGCEQTGHEECVHHEACQLGGTPNY